MIQMKGTRLLILSQQLPNFFEFGCNVVKYLRSRYTSEIIKADFAQFVQKAKQPAAITTSDAKRVGVTALTMTGIFFAGEVFGKNSIAGYWPGYDIDVKKI
ncbi:hypothetical protein DFA_04444 [Cavenderia fasciculata]|uniref:Uncharacterized protein n=1 Tax=Cavenderia fasciculata TaxID=261658 RepID=F4PPL3_CACFS|nr:uncharacterized protein DFA_04444 [Cavenderia fasciculata]EGG22326.1 hypothetical protein DFA_04444 [Cavenderia fasciculata]|eukprot:XP_004360177.1 hypothetical protein DFA_04444 [Cavenderia fasciculata]